MRHIAASGVLKTIGAVGAVCLLLTLSACSGSKFENPLPKGCAEGGNSSKTCHCAADKLGEPYELNNSEDGMGRKGMHNKNLGGVYARALQYGVDKHGRCS